MKLRIDFSYARGCDAMQYSYQIDANAPEINTKQDLNDYLRTFAGAWTGRGTLKIHAVSDTFKNENLDVLSEKVSGQFIEFNDGVVTFKRAKQVN